jgi:hypothetical protein
MCVVFVQIQLLGDLGIRQIQGDEIQAQYPYTQGLMMALEDGFG